MIFFERETAIIKYCFSAVPLHIHNYNNTLHIQLQRTLMAVVIRYHVPSVETDSRVFVKRPFDRPRESFEHPYASCSGPRSNRPSVTVVSR